MEFIVKMLILGGLIFVMGQTFPRVHVRGYGTSVLAAVVYSLLNMLLFWLFAFLAMPLMILTFFTFGLVINTLFLWMADKFISGFEIDGMGATFGVAVIITGSNVVLNALL